MMLDAKITPLIKPLLMPVVRRCDRAGLTPDMLTMSGFIIGLFAMPFILSGQFGWALVCVALNRLLDGLDGALARYQHSASSAGGYLDICLDFLFYASVPLAFGLANPMVWGAPAALLLFCFIGTGSSFLAFAIAAEKYQISRPDFNHKSFHYMQGLTEGTETVVFLLAVCLWPQAFTMLAYLFAAACGITIATRIAGGYFTLKKVGHGQS